MKKIFRTILTLTERLRLSVWGLALIIIDLLASAAFGHDPIARLRTGDYDGFLDDALRTGWVMAGVAGAVSPMIALALQRVLKNHRSKSKGPVKPSPAPTLSPTPRSSGPTVGPSPDPPVTQESDSPSDPCEQERMAWIGSRIEAMGLQGEVESWRANLARLEDLYQTTQEHGYVKGATEVGFLAGSFIGGLVKGAFKESAKWWVRLLGKEYLVGAISKRVIEGMIYTFVKELLKSQFDPRTGKLLEDLGKAQKDTIMRTRKIEALKNDLAKKRLKQLLRQGQGSIAEGAGKNGRLLSAYGRAKKMAKDSADAVGDSIMNLYTIMDISGAAGDDLKALEKLREQITQARQRIFELEQAFREAVFQQELARDALSACYLSEPYQRYQRHMEFQQRPVQE